jgi:diguanylate cyclase (GGDEF)-like protein/putative nucleotidyltransferase with HDIG domain
MKSLAIHARIYILGVIITGAIIYASTAMNWLGWNAEEWVTMIILGALAALTQILKVEGATARSSYELSWVIWGFAFANYGSSAAALTIFVSYIAEWVWHRQKWFIACFNLGAFGIALSFASLGCSFTESLVGSNIYGVAGSRLISAIIFTLINHFLVGMVIWLARGENFKQSGVMNIFPLMLDLSTFGMGLAAAWIWNFSPLAIITILAPLYLIYTTLRLPALERQTQLDTKTNVYNAKFFNQALEKELLRANRYHRPLTLVMADMDLLRNINNTYGHLAGDATLIKVAEILKDKVRDMGMVSRFGGEEFAIMLPEVSPESAEPLIESIRQEIENTQIEISTSNSPIRVTMSFGIAGRELDKSVQDLIHSADLAVYQSKLRGRNTISFATENETDSSPTLTLVDAPLPIETDLVNVDQAPKLKETVSTTPRNLKHEHDIAAPTHTTAHVKHTNAVNSHVVKKNWLGALIALMGLITVGLYTYLFFANELAIDWVGILFFVTLVGLTEYFAIEIYAKGTNLSTSVVPILAGALLLGPIGAIGGAAVQALISLIKNKSAINRFLFNFFNQAFSSMLGIAFSNLWGNYTELTLLQQSIVTMSSIMLFYLVTTGFVALAINLDFGSPFWQIWKERFSWLWVYYLILGPIIITLTRAYLSIGISGAIVMMLPLIILRFSQTQYVNRTKSMVEQLHQINDELVVRNKEIVALNEELISALSSAVDLRDPYVHGHSQQVARYATLIAKELGLSNEQIKIINKAGLLHDIGKLGIPESILFKPAKLTPQEYALITKHATLGAEIVENCQSLQVLAPFIRHHHERWDGQGYPDKLKGEDIPIEARILSAADAIEAMASDRPYRKAGTPQMILDEVNRCSGTQFDPNVVNAFLKVVEREGERIIINTARDKKVLQNVTPKPSQANSSVSLPDFVPLPGNAKLQPASALS